MKIKTMDRRTFLKLLAAGSSIAVIGSAGGLAGCSGSSNSGSGTAQTATSGTEDFDIDITIDGTTYTKWSDVVAAAKGSTVTYMGYKGEEGGDAWVEDSWTKALADKYEITLDYVDDAGIPTLILDDLDKGVKEDGGSFDIGWVNGQWFIDAQEADGYFGPITPALPNFAKYVDADLGNVKYDYDYPTDGYEAPFGSAMVVFYKDSALMPESITNTDEFLEVAKKYPGKLSYVAFDSEGGFGYGPMATFVYNIIGADVAQNLDASNEKAVREAVEPAMKWLRELNPYLWKEGKTFPASEAAMDKMLVSGELNMSMCYSQYKVGAQILKGTFPDTVESFLLDGGMMSNFNYMAIPYDAPNKAGALVAINEMLNPEMQLDRYKDTSGIVIDVEKLSDEQKAEFDAVDLGPNNPSEADIKSHSLSEWSADVELLVAKIWRDEVVGKTN